MFLDSPCCLFNSAHMLITICNLHIAYSNASLQEGFRLAFPEMKSGFGLFFVFLRVPRRCVIFEQGVKMPEGIPQLRRIQR